MMCCFHTLFLINRSIKLLFIRKDCYRTGEFFMILYSLPLKNTLSFMNFILALKRCSYKPTEVALRISSYFL